MYRKRKNIIILLTIVSVDILTKLLALNMLPYNEDVPIIDGKVNLYLTYNFASTGGQTSYMLDQESNKNSALLFSAISGLILIAYILVIKNVKVGVLYKWIGGFLLWIVLTIIYTQVNPYISGFQVSNWTASVASKTVGILLYFTFYTIAKNRFVKLSILVIIAAGIGNLLNHFYYPYHIIDFISIAGSYEMFKIGVFNIADVVFELGLLSLIVSLLILVISGKSKNTAHNNT